MGDNAKTVVELVEISTDVESTIAKEVEDVNEMSNQNLNSVGEIIIASSHLSKLTTDLNIELDKFRT